MAAIHSTTETMAGPKQIPIAQYIQKRHPRTFLTSSTRGSASNQPGRLSAITHGSKNTIAVHKASAFKWPCALCTTCSAAAACAAHARTSNGAHQRVDQPLPPGNHRVLISRALILVRTGPGRMGRLFWSRAAHGVMFKPDMIRRIGFVSFRFACFRRSRPTAVRPRREPGGSRRQTHRRAHRQRPQLTPTSSLPETACSPSRMRLRRAFRSSIYPPTPCCPALSTRMATSSPIPHRRTSPRICALPSRRRHCGACTTCACGSITASPRCATHAKARRIIRSSHCATP